jgi:AraC family transcriptional regulator of adaptative response / DNA-3-methyladenine glycosylase II
MAREAPLQRWESGRAAAGDFIVGVLSTGIYCLPTCRARRPRPENVRLFPSPAEARAAGLRACLRCRPDDHWAGIDRERDALVLALAAAREDPAAFADGASLAAAAGVGATKLHALCREHYHATPAALLARARIEHACRALAAGAAVADAGFAAGFASLSAFHDRFRRATGLTPAAYRALRGDGDGFVLALPGGYPLATLRTWGRDPQSLTDRFDGRTLLRALRMPDDGRGEDGRGALLVAEIADGLVRCRIETPAPLPPGGLYAAHAVALRALGLSLDPLPFERKLARHPELGRLLTGRRGLRVPLTADPFEALVWAVLGQQVNLAFAFALRRQVLTLCGTPAPRGLRTHPTPEAVARLDTAELVRRQLSRRKAEYLVALAQAITEGALPLQALAAAPAGKLETALLAQRGIGPWTAHYVMLRGYGLADCLPVGDAGLTLALQRFFSLAERPDPAATRALMAPFAPFRSLATFHLWTSLGDPP